MKNEKKERKRLILFWLSFYSLLGKYNSLFTRVMDKHVCFCYVARTRDYSRSNYTCAHFLSYDMLYQHME